MGNGDWGLGIGAWGLGPIPNPQSPIPNPQSPLFIKLKFKNINIYSTNQIYYLFIFFILIFFR